MKYLLSISIIFSWVGLYSQADQESDFFTLAMALSKSPQIQEMVVIEFENKKSIFILIDSDLFSSYPIPTVSEEGYKYYFWHLDELFHKGIGCYLDIYESHIQDFKADLTFRRGAMGNEFCDFFKGEATCRYKNGKWIIKKMKLAPTKDK